MASVELKNVRKAYGDVEIIHGITLGVPNGTFIVLLGPSGCGKSTLLRMIAGLEQISDGEISIGGKVVNTLHPKDRNIAMVFQNYALYAHLTVFDNLAFAMQLRRVAKDKIRQKVEWAAGILNLTPLLARYPRQLSGGQRQRVAMGRAIVRDPAVFLFDEPLSNLDAMLRVGMRTEIKELHQRLKTTTIYVTHDQIEAMTMADVICVLREGIIEQIGAPLEIYDRPANLFVAQFVGSPPMNIWHGEVAGDGELVFRSGDATLPLPPGAAVRRGQQIIYGVRPQHLLPSKSATALQAKVSVLEPTGAEIYIIAKTAGREICSVVQERVNLPPGSEISFTPLLDRVHLFDEHTGKTLNA